ncbi:MAG: TIGR02452 family protein [Eggerthellaceae bacterium]|nr:TIGR02452 family protein [Eggerthellaceae bacterium]
MPTKEERAAEAKKHNGLVRGVFESDIKAAIESAVIYEDGDGRELELPEPRFEETQAVVVWEPLARAIENANGKVCVLDSANFRNPGGNYLAGGWSPEEQICAESNLFPVLEGLRADYYEGNRQSGRGGLNTDRAIYLTDIVFTTGGVTKKRDILVVAPVNRRFALENHRSEAECDQDLANRIEAIMRIAAYRGADTLVLHAFGCGFFENDPKVVAELFKAWLDAHPGQFERVVFAIAGGPSLDVFREVFPYEETRRVQVVEETPDENDEDDEDYTDVEPTSDGRWVFD